MGFSKFRNALYGYKLYFLVRAKMQDRFTLKSKGYLGRITQGFWSYRP